MYVKNDNANIVLYDIDDTLIMLDPTPSGEAIYLSRGSKLLKVYPNYKEIETLKAAHVRGHYIRVASQGGQDWAEMVVKALGLDSYVDSIETKPKWYHDDLAADTWMKRFYNDPHGSK